MILWLAQGFGVGRIPFAPGTFGSVVGLLWTAILFASDSLLVFFCGIAGGLAISVWTCGEGEKILKQKDPGSIVMDEIAAIPLCFLTWPFLFKSAPPLGTLFQNHWPGVTLIFVLFRIFDILKPWPVKQSQSLPEGWGVTMDDVLAAFYVNVCFVAELWLLPARFRVF